MENLTLQTARLITELVRDIDRYRHALAIQNGLTVTDLRALGRVADAGIVTPKHLADSLELTSGSVTALVDRLERTGLLVRTAHPSDRRSVQLELTKAGVERMEGLYAAFHRKVLRSLKDLPEERVAAANEILQALTVHFWVVDEDAEAQAGAQA